MAINLVDLAKGLFTGDVISRAATSLNESEGGIRKAMEAIIPSILSGLISKGQSAGGPGLNNLLSDAASVQSDSGGLNALFGTSSNHGGADTSPWWSKGLALLQNLFGDKTGALSQLVSGYAGIRESSAHSLLNTAAPAVLGLVGSQAMATGQSGDSGIRSYLNTQKDHIMNSLPSGFNLAGLLGLGSISAATANVGGQQRPPVTTSYNTDDNRKKGGGKGILWLLLLLLAGLAIWYFMGMKGCKNDQEAPVEDTALTAPAEPSTTTTVTTTVTKESIKVQLPDGKELNAYKGGIEDMLVTFLKTDYTALGPDSLKNIWFDFDNLNFETGSASITAESQVQIQNLTAILMAFPKAHLKIGGYTDKTGNEPANVKLSGERATAVKAALTKAGVGSQIEGAEGYGSQYAKFPADAPEEERIKDRHVSVSVRG